VISPVERAALLLQHLQLDIKFVFKSIQYSCDKIVRKLGYLALAIDLAGAYINNDLTPKQTLLQYLVDYDKYCNELLQMDDFRGLLATQKTMWIVLDTILKKIIKEYICLQPNVLLTFLTYFKGNIIQDKLFCLANFDIVALDAELNDEIGERIPTDLRQYFPLDRGE